MYARTVIFMTSISALWGGYNAMSQHRRISEPPVAMAPAVIASVDRRIAHNGRYAAEVVAATPFAAYATQDWTIHVANRYQQPVANARISADVWMPENEKQLPTRPNVRYLGDGNYRIANFSFARPGWWNVALVIDGRAGVDSLAFNVILPQMSSTSSETKP